MSPDALMARLAAADLRSTRRPTKTRPRRCSGRYCAVGPSIETDDLEASATSQSGRPVRARLRSGGHLKRWAIVVAAAVAAVVLLLVGTTGGGPTRAFAGWSATPTTPSAGQLAAAEAACAQTDARARVAGSDGR